MKTVFSPKRKRLNGPIYVRVYETRDTELRYCIHFSREERQSHEEFNRWNQKPAYRLNVIPKLRVQ